MPPQVPQTPPGYIPPLGVYVGVIVMSLLMGALLLLGYLIYDKIIAPRKAREKKYLKARWEILEREAKARDHIIKKEDRLAFERELAEILGVDAKEFRI